MFKRSFNKFLEKPPERLYPYLYSINFKGLKTKAKKKITTEPIKCSQCGAILTNMELIQEDSKIGIHFKCEYCGSINVIDQQTIIEKLPDDIDFIIEDVESKERKKEVDQITKIGAIEGETYISVIDISGSMSGAKIEAVKKSLIQTIKDFKMNSPITKFVLIAFESSIYYYLKHDKEPIRFSGDYLFSIEGMREKMKKAVKDLSLGSIGEFADGWVQKVQNLRSMDMTALGPALYFAIISFELFKLSGRITLLTDGLANQGIGNLSGSSIGAEEFYEEMADLCNKYNIVVDVVGVSSPGDNNEMGLQTLGKLTDKTGGKMFFISDQEMGAAFAELQQTKYIGKDVKVKIITPKYMNIKNVTGAFSSKSVKESEVTLGAITEDRELFVELNSSSEGFEGKSEKEIPIQLQVEYKDKEGRKRLRVVNDRVKVTKDEKEFKSNYDQKFNVMMNIQSTGQQYYAGKGVESKKQLAGLKDEMLEEMKRLKKVGVKFSEENFTEGLNYLDDELEEMEMEEEKAASSPKASYMATMGQYRTRISQDKLEKRMKAKKKK
ncbi:MAG: hypothetical protein ACFFAN_00955 [Promethearchaeota archaeon]